MILDQLLGDVPVSRFLADHYTKLPYAAPGATGGDVAVPGSWKLLERLLDGGEADVLVARDGRQLGFEAPLAAREARRLHGEGCTILVRHAERHDPRIAALAAAFEADLGAPADAHLYCTPAGQRGFGWHYDAEDVFVLQAAGSKEYSLRRNVVNPWPLVETIPGDMHFERELSPILSCHLQAGDWLYVPTGYWHAAAAGDEGSISLAVGVMTPSGIDVHDFLRAELLESLMWRRRLPVMTGIAGASREQRLAALRAHFAELWSDLEENAWASDLAERFLAHREKRRRRARAAEGSRSGDG